MLKLKNISKQYKTGDLIQHALDNVSLDLRDSEFVAILGPSGSGKTTLLNIIGGLDGYDSGELIINGISTKKYKSRDWDSYRNHTIGFVFQSYNLIAHQSILSNVELALTIAGISRKERRRRAKEALDKVGLKDHYHKKPNQLSGGQMQRVAIARALINDPDILLADEPTGALDSDTSVQVMELLREVAKDRLVVMVTHNPELAEEYSTRTVKLRDGKIISDSNPFTAEEDEGESPVHKNMGHASMGPITSFSLSLNNLGTKKARTFLTSFAGSIGIIGIALILSLSTGVNTYINDIQESTMSSYPIQIEAETYDIANLMQIGSDNVAKEADHEMDGVYSNNLGMNMAAAASVSITQNNLTDFKAYLDDKDNEIHDYIGQNGIVYSYDTSFEVYTRDSNDRLINTNGVTIEEDNGLSGNSSFMSMSITERMSKMGSMSGVSGSFSQLMPAPDGGYISPAIEDNYEVIYGSWPESYDEVILVLDKNNELALQYFYELGFLDGDTYEELLDKIDNGEELDLDTIKLDYSAVDEKEYYLIPACDLYEEKEDGTFQKKKSGLETVERLIDKSIKLKISGIVRPTEDSDSRLILKPCAYTSALTEKIIDYTDESPVVKAQKADETINVLNGLVFEPKDDATKANDAKTFLKSLSVSEKATVYTNLMSMMGSASAMTMPEEISEDTEETTAAMPAGDFDMSAYAGMDPSAYEMYMQQGAEIPADSIPVVPQSPAAMSEADKAAALDASLENEAIFSEETLVSIYDTYISQGTYDSNLDDFGVVSRDAPASINLYSDTFENKDLIADCIDKYNETVNEEDQITYTDYVGLLMSSITTIINVITYVLVAFVAVSLVVSSIMIGIITYISVLERTKEIGILRALGASKRNISQVFNAETFIIGLFSGIIGVALTYVLIIPINAIIHHFAGDVNVSAQLPIPAAIVLIIISILLTLIGGLIPSKKAAKQDPVTALRTE